MCSESLVPRRPKQVLLVTTALVTTVVVMATVLRHNELSTVVQTTFSAHSENLDVIVKQKQEIELQRNQLSASLNSLQEKHQKLVCTTNQQGGTSETGGWCNNKAQAYNIDESLAKRLAVLLANKTVIGLGDGPGKYRRLLLDSGAVKRYDAYDGAPNIANITNGQVNFLDLTLPQYWLPTYDWVMILEVMEHIPAQFENIMLDNVARFANSGVVLSWAVTGQQGFHHINCRPPEHVLSVFKQRGFVLDSTWSLELQKAASLWWFKTNLKVFRRAETH